MAAASTSTVVRGGGDGELDGQGVDDAGGDGDLVDLGGGEAGGGDGDGVGAEGKILEEEVAAGGADGWCG